MQIAARLALMVALALSPLGCVAQTAQQNAQRINISFNGADAAKQVPYQEAFWKFSSEHSPQAPTARYCHTYVSYDVADDSTGSDKEGGLRWIEDWLKAEDGHCDEALITFKWIEDISNKSKSTHANGTPPSPAQFSVEIQHFLAKAAGWKSSGLFKGSIAYTAWNEPNNPAKSGDGLGGIAIPARLAADYYLILRKLCGSACTVAAGDFASNGQMYRDFIQKCNKDEDADPCGGASYLDIYKHFIDQDATVVGLAAHHRPEIWAYHGWDDVNNFINSNNKCTSPTNFQTCTTQAFVHSLQGSWASSVIWDDEVNAGQPGITSPDDKTQAKAAAFLLKLTGDQGTRIQRIYLTKAFYGARTPDNLWGSLFDVNGKVRPAFCVLATRQVTYPDDTCP